MWLLNKGDNAFLNVVEFFMDEVLYPGNSVTLNMTIRFRLGLRLAMGAWNHSCQQNYMANNENK